MNQPLTIFDLDETLIAGDSTLIWNEFLVQQGIVTDDNFLAEDRRLMALYAIGELNMQDYLHFTMSPISHLTCAEVDRLAELCVNEHILPRLYPQAKILLGQLNGQKRVTLMISATVSFLVKKVAQKLHFSDALGIDLVIKDGCYSEHILGTPTYREGKVERLNEWLANQPLKLSPLEFYTDSINDLPLCLHADSPNMVNPCKQLIKHAQQWQWPILTWFYD